MAFDTNPQACISIIVPAFNEQARISATIAAARALPGVVQVIVVDDGSRDATADEAESAGAMVIRTPHRGKGAALRRGIIEACGDLILLLDADLQDTAANAAPLVGPVASGRAEIAVAVFSLAASETDQAKRPGGFGLALRTARIILWLMTGRTFSAPLSGQRCIQGALARDLPWARGFGAEVGATIDATALGARIVEVPCDLRHAATGRTIHGFIHRGRQLSAILAAGIPRMLYPVGPDARPCPGRRIGVAACAWAALAVIAAVVHPWALIAIGVAAACIIAVLLALAVNDALRLRRPNYLGRDIPAAGGVTFILGPLAAWVALSGWGLLPGVGPAPGLIVPALAAVAMAAAGLADDLWGSREVSGVGGHLRALTRGRVTTGAAKAIVGALVGLVVGAMLAIHRPVTAFDAAHALLNALVIALTTNSVNLLDLRPGRAFKGFVLLSALAVAVDTKAWWSVAPIGAIALAFQPLDLGGRAMMGDVGANSLGVMAGIALASSLPWWGTVVLAAALVGIHLYSERHSISDFIARTPPLRWLDRLGQGHEYPVRSAGGRCS